MVLNNKKDIFKAKIQRCLIIINLLNDLKNELNLSIIFIAHDLSVVKYFCDRI